jgi:cytochrome c-type biogenesis protein CcmE
MNGLRRGPALALAVVVAVAVAVLVASGLHGTLVYYRTPSEVAAAPPGTGTRIRLGGQVLPGSLHEDGGETAFRLTDGRRTIAVVAHGAPPGTFKEGCDAVVEGVLHTDGVFASDTVMVKHDNEYRPLEAGG